MNSSVATVLVLKFLGKRKPEKKITCDLQPKGF